MCGGVADKAARRRSCTSSSSPRCPLCWWHAHAEGVHDRPVRRLSRWGAPARPVRHVWPHPRPRHCPRPRCPFPGPVCGVIVWLLVLLRGEESGVVCGRELGNPRGVQYRWVVLPCFSWASCHSCLVDCHIGGAPSSLTAVSWDVVELPLVLPSSDPVACLEEPLACESSIPRSRSDVLARFCLESPKSGWLDHAQPSSRRSREGHKTEHFLRYATLSPQEMADGPSIRTSAESHDVGSSLATARGDLFCLFFATGAGIGMHVQPIGGRHVLPMDLKHPPELDLVRPTPSSALPLWVSMRRCPRSGPVHTHHIGSGGVCHDW